MHTQIGRRFAALTILGLLAGCASPRVESTSSPTALRLPRPDRVIISPFTALARDARPDQSAGGRVARAVEQEPANPAELRAARAAQTALQQALVRALGGRGLPAEAGRSDTAPGNVMLVQGQIVSLNESSRTQRTLIGFGAGRSSITAEVQLLYVAGSAAPQFLESFEAETTSPATPGLSLPAMSGGAPSETGYPDATSLADAIARRIAAFAATQGWVPVAR
jgi:hypothetical protein